MKFDSSSLSSRQFCLLFAAVACCFAFSVQAQTQAFPGALGFGANATGGRGGSVYHVTTLADSGAGSFRDAVSHSGRIIIFDVGGYINLQTAVSCSGNLTIAGQTAPGAGIGFRGGEISFANRSNIICRFIRIRPGSETASTGDDCLSLYRARDVICDHVSMEFGPWNNIDAVSDDWQNFPVTDVTFQNCIIANPSKNAKDGTDGQQFGAHTESVNSSMSWFYNIFANSHNRNPLAKINTIFVNNVLYNCSAGYTTHTSTEFSHDIVNNYFISGPAFGGSSDFPWFQVDNNQSIYYSGNLFDGNRDSALNGSITTPYWYQGGGGGTVLSVPWSSITTNVPTFDPAGAFRYVVSQGGTLPRDSMDFLLFSQAQTLGNGPTGTGIGTVGPNGSLYSDQTQTGLANNGYGTINGGIAPADSDFDGMPDFWEKTVSLNYLSSSDNMTIALDGYANIEHYLNWLADPHTLTTTNSAVDVDLWNLTSGFTNAAPVYSLDNATNGNVTLNSGHIAHFQPTTNFFGLGSFRFSVVANDGSTYTNTVTVAIVPQSATEVQPSNLIWVGDGVQNLWDVGNATNWFDETNFVAFSSGDTVTFDDTGANTPAINLSGLLAAGTVYVIAGQDYTFGGSGSLAGPASLFKTGSGQLNINTTNNYSGGTIINEGVVQLGDGVNFSGSIGGNITNNDTLIFNNPGSVSSSSSLSGSGVLIKNGAGALTLTGTQTYTNVTTINAGSLQFSGSIPPGDIINNNSLIFAPSSSTTLGNRISGSGAVTVNASGPTTLNGANTYSGGTTNSSGTLRLVNNSAVGTGPVVYLSGSIQVGDGNVVTNTFVVPSSTADSMLDCVSGTGTWAGDIVLVGGGASFRPSGVNGTLILTGSGALGNRNFIIPRGSVRFAGNASFSASGSTCAFDRNTTGNSGFFTLADNASISFNTFSLGGGTASGGRMILTIGDSAVFSANTFDIHNSTASAAISSVNLDGGTLTIGNYVKTRTGSNQRSTNFFNGGILKASGNSAAFMPALSGFVAIVKSGGAIIDDGGFSIAVAAPLTHDPVLGATTDGGLTKLGPGTLTLAAAETYTGPTIISAGVLSLYAPPIGSIANSSSIYIASGAQLDFSLGGTAAMTLGNGKKISGNGSVKGDFTVGSGAILSPGASFGTLTFSNSLTLSSGCTNIFEITHSPVTNDVAKIIGTLNNGGTLIVTNVGLAALDAGDSFKLFDANGYNGSFAKVVLPSLEANLAWNTNSLNSSGVISVVSVPATPPILGTIRLSGNDLILNGSGGVAHTEFYLLSATNISTPSSNWTRLLTNQFDDSGSFNFTNAIEINSPQNFFRLQIP